MASEGHLRLSEVIKSVHMRLRTRSQEVGPEVAWLEHLQQRDVLQSYSKAMKALAEDHWARINRGDRKIFCRINWIVRTVCDYFYNGLLEKELKKESMRFQMMLEKSAPQAYAWDEKLKVLDVGSCFNPFRSIEQFETFPIDLCPASPDVHECNFLEVNICEPNDCHDWFSTNPVSRIPSQYFDLVVFCLFLEYLPCVKQRLAACSLAWKCLRLHGVLIIVTPDSNHQSAHSKLMKEWNLALIRIGFVRFKIEKLKYLYCMSFRKTSMHLIPGYLDMKRYQCENEPTLHTSQDFVDYKDR